MAGTVIIPAASCHHVTAVSLAMMTLARVETDPKPRLVRAAGILTTAELLAAGKSERQIKTLVQQDMLVSLGRGVFARAGPARKFLAVTGGDRLLTVAAALAVAGPGMVVSHQSAARMYGMDLLDKPPADVTLTCPREHGSHGRAGIKLYAAQLPGDQVTIRLGAPVTTPARTVIDLARTLTLRAGVVTADSALRRGLTTRAELQSTLAALPGRRGIVRAAQVVAFADERAESALESIARVLFRDLGLPKPELQVWLGGTDKGAVGRVDFYWKQYRTVVEVDGKSKYQDPERARWQLRRDALLRADGLEVVHLSWYDITRCPDLVNTLIREAFQRGRLPNA